MASPNSTFTELVTTTFRNHRKEIMDNVSKHNALYRMLGDQDKVRTESGGTSITIPLEYGQNGTYQRYSGLDLLNVSQSDVLSAAEFAWRNIAIHVVANGNELRINNGPTKIASLAKARIRNMQVRYVHEPDPLRQAPLEIYVAVATQARYNDFDTH